jgi:YesN/AraC family two-component response regulator
MTKILIVDDEEMIRDFLKDFFEISLNIKDLVFANDGLEAYALTTQYKFDLICSDHQMPFMKGAQFLLALRQKEGQNQHTPFVMISSFIPELSTDLSEIENLYLLDKPVDFQRLTRYVKIAMGKGI